MNKTVIAEGSIINASSLENSVIGIRSRIGYGTNIVSTYIMGNDYYETLEEINQSHQNGTPLMGIGERCNIQGAIIDKNVRIGDEVNINGGTLHADTEHELYTIKDGVVVIKKGAILHNGFTL